MSVKFWFRWLRILLVSLFRLRLWSCNCYLKIFFAVIALRDDATVRCHRDRHGRIAWHFHGKNREAASLHRRSVSKNLYCSDFRYFSFRFCQVARTWWIGATGETTGALDFFGFGDQVCLRDMSELKGLRIRVCGAVLEQSWKGGQSVALALSVDHRWMDFFENAIRIMQRDPKYNT